MTQLTNFSSDWLLTSKMASQINAFIILIPTLEMYHLRKYQNFLLMLITISTHFIPKGFSQDTTGQFTWYLNKSSQRPRGSFAMADTHQKTLQHTMQIVLAKLRAQGWISSRYIQTKREVVSILPSLMTTTVSLHDHLKDFSKNIWVLYRVSKRGWMLDPWKVDMKSSHLSIKVVIEKST